MKKIKDFFRNARIAIYETFLTPVTVSKCDHDFKLIRFQQYRVGRTKYSVSTHKCKKCKMIKKYDTKY